MGDQDLLWELFERHFFVKSHVRKEHGLIQKIPQLREEDWARRETLNTRRRNSPNKRPLTLPSEAAAVIKHLKHKSNAKLRLL